MRQRSTKAGMAEELSAAIGLVWGHIGALQHEEAHALASACLQLWPGDRNLLLLAGYAATELGMPADLDALRHAFGAQPCLELISRRQPA
ncbi:hypothetical protein SAMN05518865_106266 [Duganella sp. CF458]|uniref:hypothetical protein n=1 Tax=Duganella sp. CF458 TaxID=1884368 RepID=UPI0008E80081|nr:hypothetical protein [Duganella sp. CF458]SFF95467.1 hypothetical protein SAMN05518865_106266 [Duganella sp. CF458]